MSDPTSMQNAVAIIGMACRFPKSNSVIEFWNNLTHGNDCITRSRTNSDSKNVNAEGLIDNPLDFDHEFFKIPEHEAKIIDPQHRLFLELAYRALEDANHLSKSQEQLTGVFASSSNNSYLQYLIQNQPTKLQAYSDLMLKLSNDTDYLASRVSYKLNLNGPSMAIQTACSSSLSCIAMACTHILTNQCKMALAGSVSIRFPYGSGYIYQNGMILSESGVCRPFDNMADGTVPGHGGGVVLLKNYDEAVKDGDQIHALILGFGTSNDGAPKHNFSTPSSKGQVAAIQSAIRMAGISPNVINYIEAHGTGTRIGDAIELDTIRKALALQNRPNPLCIGSVKSNIGHLMEASGIAGIIKSVMCLKNRQIPPTINYTQPNSTIQKSESGVVINNSLIKMDSQRELFVGVSAFGMGGSNSHVILKNAPVNLSSSQSKPSLSLYKFKRSELSLIEEPNRPRQVKLDGKDKPTNFDLKAVMDSFREVLSEYHGDEDKSFFDCGGDSLSALELLALIEKSSGIVLSLNELHQNPSALKLSRLIEQKKSVHMSHDLDGCSIVQISGDEKNETSKNIVFIHQIDGYLFSYKDLFSLLQYSKYGIVPNIGVLSQSCSSIRDVANLYLDQLKSFGLNGNYIFVGASLGGLIAHEMACIESSKSEVELVLIDSIPTDPEIYKFSHQAFTMHGLLDIFGIQADTLHMNEKVLQSLVLQALNVDKFPQLNQEEILVGMDFFLKILPKHEMGVFSGHTYCYFASKNFFTKKGLSLRKLWSQFTPKASFEDLGGNHISMMRKDNIVPVADKIIELCQTSL